MHGTMDFFWKMTRVTILGATLKFSPWKSLFAKIAIPGISLGSPTSGVYLIQFMTSQTFRQVCIRHSGGKNLHLEVPDTKNPKGWRVGWRVGIFRCFFLPPFKGYIKALYIYRSTYVYDDYIYIHIFIYIYIYIHLHTVLKLKKPLSPKTNLKCNRWTSSNLSSLGRLRKARKGCSSRLFSMKWLDSVWSAYGCKVFRLVLLVCCFYGIMSCVSWKQGKTMHFQFGDSGRQRIMIFVAMFWCAFKLNISEPNHNLYTFGMPRRQPISPLLHKQTKQITPTNNQKRTNNHSFKWCVFSFYFSTFFLVLKGRKIHTHPSLFKPSARRIQKVSASETVKLLKRQLEECFMAKTQVTMLLPSRNVGGKTPPKNNGRNLKVGWFPKGMDPMLVFGGVYKYKTSTKRCQS